MRGASALAAAATLVGAGCGGSAGDLLAFEVSGGAAGGDVRLVVTQDGRGTCDSAELSQIPSELLIEAREVERELEGLAEGGKSFESGGGAGSLTYVARTRSGTVTWSDVDPDLPPELEQATTLAQRLRADLCPDAAALRGGQLRTLPFERARSLARST